jgi:hypothetical protein
VQTHHPAFIDQVLGQAISAGEDRAVLNALLSP